MRCPQALTPIPEAAQQCPNEPRIVGARVCSCFVQSSFPHASKSYFVVLFVLSRLLSDDANARCGAGGRFMRWSGDALHCERSRFFRCSYHEACVSARMTSSTSRPPCVVLICSIFTIVFASYKNCSVALAAPQISNLHSSLAVL